MARRRRRKLSKTASSRAASTPPAAPDPAARARRLLRLVVIAYLFLAALYATHIPAGKGPDESAHVRYIEFLARERALPVFDSQSPGPDYEFHQPPLFYVVALPTYLLAGGGGATADQTVRFVCILIGLAFLYLTFALARALAPDRPYVAPAATAVVALLPMHLALVATVGNDVLTEVFVTAALLLIVRHLRGASDYRRGDAAAPGPASMLAVGLLVGLGLLTKSIAIVLFPVAWLAAALAARGPQTYEWRRCGRDLLVVTAVALALAGPWLLRNHMLYGDPLAHKAFVSAFQDRPSPQDFMSAYGSTPSLYVVQVTILTVASALGVFGPVFANRFIFYPYWVYLIFGIKALIEAGGFLKYAVRSGLADWQRQAWWVASLLAALLLAGFIRFNLSFFQAQARYLFPALAPAAAALSLGIHDLSPPRWRPVVLVTALSLLGLLALFGFSFWVVPQFSIPLPAELGGPS